ncbi:hypothetical protein T12_3664, partial [Trichinella patagoniensis]
LVSVRPPYATTFSAFPYLWFPSQFPSGAALAGPT